MLPAEAWPALKSQTGVFVQQQTSGYYPRLLCPRWRTAPAAPRGRGQSAALKPVTSSPIDEYSHPDSSPTELPDSPSPCLE